MRFRSRALKLLTVLLLLWLTPTVVDAQNLEDRIVEHTLENGMTFLFMERHQAPVFTAMIVVKAGAVDEPAGKAGLAHMLEHMLFKGTEVLGTRDYDAERRILEKIDRVGVELSEELRKGENADEQRVKAIREELRVLQTEAARFQVDDEIGSLYSRHGAARLNASTSNDITRYYVSLPSNSIALWAMIESDRMANLVFREFYSERDVVAEERRLRVDTNPYGALHEAFFAAAFIAHPYRRPVIGWSSDIAGFVADDARAFYRRYYVPANSVAAVVGDIDVADAVVLAERYFGRLRAAKVPDRLVTREPDQNGERRVAIEWDAEPQLLIGYHKPTLPHRDDFVFDVIDSILSRGRTSRLYTKLVKELRIATSVDTWQGAPGARYDNLFVIDAVPRNPHSTAEVEAAVYAEIERLKTEPVAPHELQKVRNQIQADFIRELDSNFGMAAQLAYFEAIAGDWRYILQAMREIDTVSAQDVQRVASTYLVKENRTVATIARGSSKLAEEDG
jgi:predicted Zn-dependent peptidase